MPMLTGPLFTDIPASMLAKLKRVSTVRRFPAGHVLFHEQDPAPALMVIVEGGVRVWRTSRRGSTVAVHLLGPGSLPGCNAVFCQARHSTSVTAVTAIRMAMWPAEAVRELMLDCPAFSANALVAVATQAEEMLERLYELSTQGVEQRLAGVILRLLGAQRPGSGPLPEILLTRQALAELSATTLYTVSRFVSRWERRGIVGAGRARIFVHKPSALMDIRDQL